MSEVAQTLSHLLADPACLWPALDVKAICFHADSKQVSSMQNTSRPMSVGVCLDSRLRFNTRLRFDKLGTDRRSGLTAQGSQPQVTENVCHFLSVNFKCRRRRGHSCPTSDCWPRWAEVGTDCSLVPDMQGSCRFASSASAALPAGILLASTRKLKARDWEDTVFCKVVRLAGARYPHSSFSV